MNKRATVTGSTHAAGKTWITPDGRHMMAVEMPDGVMAVEMVQEIATGLIDPSPINRDEFDPEKAQDMEDSLRENGQIMPGIVRPKEGGRYELVAGERRWRGCVKIGLPKMKVMVRDYTDSQAAEILLFENLERENLSPLQEARIYQSLLELKNTEGRNLFTQETIAERRFGDRKKLWRVAQVMKLLALPAVMKKALQAGEVKVRQAFLVARIADPKDREKAAKEVLKDQYTGQPMTVEKAMRHISDNYQVNLQGAKFDRDDADILSDEVKEALGMTGKPGEDNDGSCARCPHLAKNNPAYADELAVKSKAGKSQTGIDPNTCTRAKCHAMKLDAVWHRKALVFAKKHHLPEDAILPLSEGANKGWFWQNKWGLPGYVLVDEKLTHDDLDRNEDEMPAKVPTWREVMKGCDVPYKIVASASQEPVLVAEEKLAITAAKQTRPDLFAEVEIPETRRGSGELSPEEVEANKQAKLAAQREAKIKKEVTLDTVKEVVEAVREKGLGLEGMKILCRAAWRLVNNAGEVWCVWMGAALDEAASDTVVDDLVDEMLEGRTMHDLQALLALMLTADDVLYSSHYPAEDFATLSAEMKVDTKAVEKRVRKAHELADKAAAKAAAAAEKLKRKSDLKNAELATAGILAQGDEQRAKAPSRKVAEASPWERLMTMEPEISEPNEHGVFTLYERCVFSTGKGQAWAAVLLSRGVDGYAASYEYANPKSPTKESGGGNPSRRGVLPTKIQALVNELSPLCTLVESRPEMKKVAALLLEAAREGNEALRAHLLELQGAADGAPSFEAQVQLIAAGEKKPSDFIGAKPSPEKDPEGYKKWSQARMRLVRAAEKLKKAA